MPSTDDWRSALSRAGTSPRKPSDTSWLQADASQRRAESAKGALALATLARASSPVRSTRSPTASGIDASVTAVVHPLAAARPNSTSAVTSRPEESSAGSGAAAGPSNAPLSASAVELNEIKQSVERLRAQRSHVEQLGQQTDRLKAQLAQQEAHNERLRGELARVQGLSQENVGLLQTVKLLEERARTLEGLCHDKRAELRRAGEQFASVDRERQQLLLTMESIEQEHAEVVRAHVAEQSRLRERLAQLERRQSRATSDKLSAAEAELEQQRADKRRLRDAVEELELQVQQLLATTARQTTVIEDCDRALGEAKRQRASAEQSREDQQRAMAALQQTVRQLEARAAAAQRGWDADKLRSAQAAEELEGKLEALQDALQERDRQLLDMQRVQLARDRSRTISDEAHKELQRREQALQSEVAELRIELRDVADEKALLGERVAELQARLESEQRDRQRWASARLQLLAEFCDEENKLTSALQLQGDRHRAHGRSARLAGQEELEQQPPSPGSSSAGRIDWSDDRGGGVERRRGSIVFG